MARITLANSEIAFDCPADDTVLRAALRSGLGFPYECNVGSCGNCRFELVEGEIRHERQDAPAWTERDRQRKRWLGCQSRALTDCRIKVALRDHYKSRHPPKRTRAQLFATEDLTHDMREFRFRLSDRAPFLPGQYALLYVPGVTGARAYSMCNVSDSGEEWHFQIKRVPGGAATERLFSHTPPATKIAVDGPFGMAYLREDAPRDVLCLAGGSGLSPMISIARAFAASPKLKQRELHFVYGGRRTRDICGERMLELLDGFGSRIRYYPCISMPEDDPDAASFAGHTGFVHDVARALFGERLPQFEVYFAGPPAMATAVQAMLISAKVPPAQMHFDQFY
ncbi:MAG TPA: 2Fe-2S iron-sulfur cluster-binding protein [Hyphomicrobiaceae bacterium]|nr:2Fe-2S iron-sulfur cluster-binding protein [Hyphomicrobiaceae bacterium]